MTESAHHALVRIDPGSLLLDLRSGGVFQLNEAATFVWERWLSKMTASEIAVALAEAYSLPRGTADEHVAATLTSTVTAPPLPTEFVYERSADRYIFSRDAQPILAVDDRGRSIAFIGPFPLPREDLRNVLLSIAPKLLALRGHHVLHASAVGLDEKIVVFCGESGAGKTTTARLLANAGATLVCEDKLVIRFRSERVEAEADIEAGLLRWSEKAADILAQNRTAPCPDLDGKTSEPPRVVREIAFIDAGRRATEKIVAIPLTVLAGAGNIFRNAFYGSDVAQEWERQLQWAGEIARHVGCYELTMPAGIAHLAAEASEIVKRRSIRSR
jgi:hypothetical protein